MGVEAGVGYIDDLVVTNPESTDVIAEGDDHIRLTKQAVKGSFTSLGREAVTKTAAEINNLIGDGDTGASLVDPVISGSLSGSAIGRGALVLHTSVNTVPTTTRTVINFQSEDYDTDGIHDNVTNNTRLTVPSGVTKVKVIGRVNLAGGGANLYEGRILKNGSPAYNGAPTIEIEGLQLGDVNFNLASTVLTVVAGDYFEFDVYQTSGGNKNTRTGGDDTWFAMEIVK